MKPLTPDEKRIAKAYLSRKIRTVPFLVLMFLSLLFFSTNFFFWIEAQLAWHKTNATIFEVTNGTCKFEYHCDSSDEYLIGSMERIKIFYSLPYGDDPALNDKVRIAYNIDNPHSYRILPKYESKMITWASAFAFCFIMYFWLEYELKKRSPVKITG